MVKKNCFFDIKNSKLFKPFDIVIYLIIFFLLITLFFVFVIIPKKSSGFVINVENKFAFAYYFETGLYIGKNPNISLDKEEDNDFVYLTIFLDNKKEEYNKLKIDKKNKTICVIESNCLNHDCEHFSPIKDKGSIICLPHKLVITPAKTGYADLIVGG